MLAHAPQLRLWLRQQWQKGAAAGACVLLCAAWLKHAYSQAGADSLWWILAPSCSVAARLGDLRLVAERGAGFISHDPRMVVGAACAGVNFLVVAWLALYFCAQACMLELRRKLGWLCASLLVAYAATVITNGARIALAAHLLNVQLPAGLLTTERLHCLLGVVLYCGTLLGLCRGAVHYHSSGSTAGAPRARRHAYFWYLGVVLGVPLLHGAWLRDPDKFIEHAILTLGGSTAIFLVGRLFGLLDDRLHSRSECRPWPSQRFSSSTTSRRFATISSSCWRARASSRFSLPQDSEFSRYWRRVR
jgi:exosortase K